MTGHGINHIEKVLLIAQRLGKLSANIAACWTTVRLGPMSEMGPKAALTAPKSNFRFTPESGLRSDIAPCPKSATFGLTHRMQLPALFDYQIGISE